MTVQQCHGAVFNANLELIGLLYAANSLSTESFCLERAHITRHYLPSCFFLPTKLLLTFKQQVFGNPLHSQSRQIPTFKPFSKYCPVLSFDQTTQPLSSILFFTPTKIRLHQPHSAIHLEPWGCYSGILRLTNIHNQ